MAKRKQRDYGNRVLRVNDKEAPVVDTFKDVKKFGSMEIENIDRLSLTYKQLSKLILRDLNNNTRTPVFSVFSKDDIINYLSNPYSNAANLRKAITYIYVASSHFRRLIDYFAGLTDLAYIVSPFKIDPKRANARIIGSNYRKVLDTLSSMSIKTQFPKIVKTCLKDDVFYGTIWSTKDVITIQQLPSEYCEISSIEGNVFNVSFNFSYFDSYKQYIQLYPPEFEQKYNAYKSGKTKKWVELDCPTSFAIKCNYEIPEYPIPPFAGILREIYDLEDYRNLKLARTALENYAMLSMELPMDEDGNWLIDYDKAVDFWSNLSDVVPPEVGTVLTPMDIKKISFERNSSKDSDTTAQAEQDLFGAAGVSSLLFNNEKA